MVWNMYQAKYLSDTIFFKSHETLLYNVRYIQLKKFMQFVMIFFSTILNQNISDMGMRDIR